ncbi:amino acid permease C-terminal domain-containing protein [Flavobacterium sp. BFFFF1]
MTSIGTLLAFVMVCLGILILRKQQPDVERPFKTPFVPLVPVLGIITCLIMMFSLPLDTWIRLIVWLLIGFGIYYFYGKKNSRLRNQQKQEIVNPNSITDK